MKFVINDNEMGDDTMSKTLDTLLPGEVGVISSVTGSGPIKRRIVDMGLIAGTVVRVQKYAPLGDPIEIKVKNFNLSLRKMEAATITVNPMEGTK
jgi:Fe2+ transport system protein FeoA